MLDVDGSTITMPDTPENQAEYPQMSQSTPRLRLSHRPDRGRVLAGRGHGPRSGDRQVSRQADRREQPVSHAARRAAEGDVVLADRYFSGWFDMALLEQRGVDIVVRKHQLRPTDFRTGRRLGPGRPSGRWRKPQRPAWMSQEQYDSLPDELTLREVRVLVAANKASARRNWSSSPRCSMRSNTRPRRSPFCTGGAGRRNSI